MAVTNPDSLLDKNGLAYYHSKVKQEIKDAFKATINITQSANQTIDCFLDYPSYDLMRLIREHGSNDWWVGEQIGLNDYNWRNGNPENQEPLTESFELKNCYRIVFRVKPDPGYKTGTLVVDGGFIDYRYDQQSIDQNNADEAYCVWCPGDVINVSATPATVKPTRTITLHANPPYVDDFVYEGESNGTYCYNNTTWTGENIYFNKSNDVTVTAYDGDQLRFQRVGNSYYNQTLTKSDSSALSYSGSGSNRYYYYNVNGSNETITLNLIHLGRTVGFYLHPSSSAGSFITGVNFVVNYSYVDSNTGQTITDTQTVTNGRVQFNLPWASTGTYTVTLPSGYQLSGNSSPSLTGQLSDDNSDYHFFVTQS